MEIENIQKVLIKKKKHRISIPVILVIVWCTSSTAAYLYQFNHLFEKIWKLIVTL